MDKPNLLHEYFPYFYMVFLMFIGGTASFALKVRKGLVRWCNLTELVGEYTIAIVAGLATHHLCKAYHVPEDLSNVAMIIASVSGSKTIEFLETKMSDKVSKLFS